MSFFDDDAIVACPECSRNVYAAALCECEADNPLCPLCHVEWHTEPDRRAA